MNGNENPSSSEWCVSISRSFGPRSEHEEIEERLAETENRKIMKGSGMKEEEEEGVREGGRGRKEKRSKERRREKETRRGVNAREKRRGREPTLEKQQVPTSR